MGLAVVIFLAQINMFPSLGVSEDTGFGASISAFFSKLGGH